MSDDPPADLAALVALVARLRAPGGCPWDREQRLGDLRAYLLEEAHESAAAIDRAVEAEDWQPLSEELGDLLFQIAFAIRLAEEAGAFDLARVIEGAHAKMVARHPHVFGDETLADSAAVRAAWERRKLAERSAGTAAERSLLAGVPDALPALVGAYRLTQKAAAVGFDWPEVSGALAKVREELEELEEALAASPDAARDGASARVRDELGDTLFALANVARKLELDPEAALAAGNRKFRRRFEAMERALAARGRDLARADLAEMDALWDAVKRDE